MNYEVGELWRVERDRAKEMCDRLHNRSRRLAESLVRHRDLQAAGNQLRGVERLESDVGEGGDAEEEEEVERAERENKGGSSVAAPCSARALSALEVVVMHVMRPCFTVVVPLRRTYMAKERLYSRCSKFRSFVSEASKCGISHKSERGLVLKLHWCEQWVLRWTS